MRGCSIIIASGGVHASPHQLAWRGRSVDHSEGKVAIGNGSETSGSQSCAVGVLRRTGQAGFALVEHQDVLPVQLDWEFTEIELPPEGVGLSTFIGKGR